MMNNFLKNKLLFDTISKYLCSAVLYVMFIDIAYTVASAQVETTSNILMPKKTYYEVVKKAESGDEKCQLMLGDMYFDGKSLFNGIIIEKNYNKSFLWYMKSAKIGNARGQYNVGIMYRDGLGVKGDVQKAVKWLKLSSNQSFILAQSELGVLYLIGVNGDFDYNMSYSLLNKAAKAGNANAQNSLGYMYLYGLGVEQDSNSAKELFISASNQGVLLARMNLSKMYYEGIGVDVDLIEAYKWIRLAALSGKRTYVGIKEQIATMLSSDELKQAESLIQQWKLNHQ